MKILQQINYETGLGADRWIVNGYKDAFEELGHGFFFLTSRDDLGERLKEVEPDLLFLGADRVIRKNLPAIAAARARGAKVFAWVDSMVLDRPETGEIILHENPADFYYGETEPEWMAEFTRRSGHSYHLLPNATNPKNNFPTAPVKKYQYDIVFMGAMMPNKREAFSRLLFPLLNNKKYRVGLFGPNWTAKDNALRLAARVARNAGLMSINNWISKKRITVPAEEESQLYSSAKVSINIHERGEHIKNHVILNERTFKIPASGGFEICDFVPPLRKYFAEDEVVMADDRNGSWVDDWFKKIEYYLEHDTEREAIRKRGTARAQRDHTYRNRVARLLEIVNTQR